MRVRALAFLFAPLSVALAIGQPTSILPETIVIPSGNLQLKGFLWKPNGPGPFPTVLFNHGSGGADADHTAGLPITEAAEKLAEVFLKHGYAFLYLFRRGQGLPGDQGPFMQDILRQEAAARGKQARQHLQYMLATTDHLHDVMAALSFLKTAPAIDAKRIAIAGHSFGGQVTLLAAERDNTLRAAVTFAAAAGSWGVRLNCVSGSELRRKRQRLRSCWFRRQTITAQRPVESWPANFAVCTNLTS